MERGDAVPSRSRSLASCLLRGKGGSAQELFKDMQRPCSLLECVEVRTVKPSQRGCVQHNSKCVSRYQPESWHKPATVTIEPLQCEGYGILTQELPVYKLSRSRAIQLHQICEKATNFRDIGDVVLGLGVIPSNLDRPCVLGHRL